LIGFQANVTQGNLASLAGVIMRVIMMARLQLETTEPRALLALGHAVTVASVRDDSECTTVFPRPAAAAAVGARRLGALRPAGRAGPVGALKVRDVDRVPSNFSFSFNMKISQVASLNKNVFAKTFKTILFS
jgi:hypothetical protein